MHSWRMFVVVYIMALGFLAFLLGHIGSPGNWPRSWCPCPYRVTERTVNELIQGAVRCPWQLEAVTMRRTGKTAGNEVSSLPATPEKS